MRFVLFLFCACLTACASPFRGFDKRLLRAYSVEDQQKEPFKAPYITFYRKGNFVLSFVGADHAVGSDSPTCKTIRKVFAEDTPAFLIVEGTAFTKINNPRDIERAIHCKNGLLNGCEEDTCAINEAIDRNIAFAYGEPDDEKIRSELLEKGYSAEDLAFFYALRQIPQIKRQGFKLIDDLKLELTKRLPGFAKRVRSTGPLTLKEFERSYVEKMKSKINYELIDSNSVGPSIKKDASWANRMAHEVGIVREQFLASLIEKQLRKYQKVIVVYGQGHLVKQRKMLDASFGAAENKKYF